MTCWMCSTSDGDDDTCEECRTVLAVEQTCRSSAGCRAKAGHGRYGMLCSEHAAEITDVKGRWFSAAGSVLQAERKPNAPEPAATKFVPPTKQRVPKEQTAGLIARVVHASEAEWMTAAEIAEALGTTRNSSSLRRALAYAREQRWIATREGRGFVAGEVEPLAATAAASLLETC